MVLMCHPFHVALSIDPTTLGIPNTSPYNNKITSIIPSHSYMEICFRGNDVHIDENPAGKSPEGGFCTPGDTGLIVEKFLRLQTRWFKANEICLQEGMRLPGQREWQWICQISSKLRIRIGAEWEWTYHTRPISKMRGNNHIKGVGVYVFGKDSCLSSELHLMAYDTGFGNTASFRCVR